MGVPSAKRRTTARVDECPERTPAGSPREQAERAAPARSVRLLPAQLSQKRRHRADQHRQRTDELADGNDDKRCRIKQVASSFCFLMSRNRRLVGHVALATQGQGRTRRRDQPGRGLCLTAGRTGQTIRWPTGKKEAG